MTITRENLIGKPQGKNQWGKMTYATGLIETYLPGEHNYNDPDGEGPFLASLCLFLLSGKNDPSTLFKADDRTFLEHFVFHNIPKQKFLTEMAKHPNEQEKVKAILGLIKSDLNKTKDMRFHDFYYNGYKSVKFADKVQRLHYCQQLHVVFNKELATAEGTGRSMSDWMPPSDWSRFTVLCTKYGIDLTKKPIPATPLPIGIALVTINKLFADYLQERKAVVDSNGNTKQYFHSTFTSLQKSYTQKSNAVEALQKALKGENVDLSSHLATLRDGKLGKHLRTFIKEGNANSLVDREVNTVRDFVAALQEKVTGHSHSL